MKKIFKYLALVPLLTVLIFNCIIYGSVIATDDNTVEYPVFLGSDFFTQYDFSDVETILKKSSNTFDSWESFLNGDKYYFICAYFASVEDYKLYIGESSSSDHVRVYLTIFTFHNDNKFVENDHVFETGYDSCKRYVFQYFPSNGQFEPALFIKVSN